MSAGRAAEKGGKEVALAVLAATSTTAIVFFPVTLFYGVSKYLFVALALAVVLSHLRFLHCGDDRRAAVLRQFIPDTASKHGEESGRSAMARYIGAARFNVCFERIAGSTTKARHAQRCLSDQADTVGSYRIVVVSSRSFPFSGRRISLAPTPANS